MAAKDTTSGRDQDRARVAALQAHEVKYETGKIGVSKDEVKSVVKSAGNNQRRSKRSCTGR